MAEVIGYESVYKWDEDKEIETKDISGYKLIVKWDNYDSNYTSYLFKESYFTKDEKEINLYKILDEK